jgi:hypothetical protein
VTEESTAGDFNKFDEYKLFVENTAGFSDRRQTASNVMVALNALLVAGVGALFAKAAEGAPWLLLIAALLLTAGFFVCVVWLALIRKYEKMIDTRVGALTDIEEEMPGCHHWHRVMHERFYARYRSFSEVEQWLPVIFMALYGVLVTSIVAGVVLLSQLAILRTVVCYH